VDKNIRDFTKGLSTEGLKLLALTRTGKSHYRAQIIDTSGKTMTYVLANSSSDARASKNRLADIRRFFNN
jgi:hypothetical protein